MPMAALLQYWPLSMLGQGSLYVECSGLSGGSVPTRAVMSQVRFVCVGTEKL